MAIGNLQRSPKSGFRCTAHCFAIFFGGRKVLQRSPKSGFRCTLQGSAGCALSGGSCNDRPSQVSVAPWLAILCQILAHNLQRSPKSGFRCTPRDSWGSRLPSMPSCNDRPSQVSVAPLPSIAFSLRTYSCNDRPSQVSVAPSKSRAIFQQHPVRLQRSPKSGFRCTLIPIGFTTRVTEPTCNDRPSQVSVAPAKALSRLAVL